MAIFNSYVSLADGTHTHTHEYIYLYTPPLNEKYLANRRNLPLEATVLVALTGMQAGAEESWGTLNFTSPSNLNTFNHSNPKNRNV